MRQKIDIDKKTTNDIVCFVGQELKITELELIVFLVENSQP